MVPAGFTFRGAAQRYEQLGSPTDPRAQLSRSNGCMYADVQTTQSLCGNVAFKLGAASSLATSDIVITMVLGSCAASPQILQESIRAVHPNYRRY